MTGHHWFKLSSSNMRERSNKKIDMVCQVIFLNPVFLVNQGIHIVDLSSVGCCSYPAKFCLDYFFCLLSSNFLYFSCAHFPFTFCCSRAGWLWGRRFLFQSVIFLPCVLCPCVFCPCVPSVPATVAARERIWMIASSFGHPPPFQSKKSLSSRSYCPKIKMTNTASYFCTF